MRYYSRKIYGHFFQKVNLSVNRLQWGVGILGPGGAVIFISFAVKHWRLDIKLVSRIGHNRDKPNRFTAGFPCSLFANFLQSLHSFIITDFRA